MSFDLCSALLAVMLGAACSPDADALGSGGSVPELQLPRHASEAAAYEREASSKVEDALPRNPAGAKLGTTTPARKAPPSPREPSVDCTLTKETGYRRGKAFPIEVMQIDNDLIEKRTAAAFWAMREAASQEKLDLVIYSAFRSQAEQRYFYRCYRDCNCNNCTRAAPPGHSNHQSGKALDIAQYDGVVEWLGENAERFGFRQTIKTEPWHWEYRSGLRPDRSGWPAVCPQPSSKQPRPG